MKNLSANLCVTLILLLFIILFLNISLTEPLESKTFPNLIIAILVFFVIILVQIISEKNLVIPNIFLGSADLSVEIWINFFFLYLMAAFNMFFVPKTLVLIPSILLPGNISTLGDSVQH